MSENALKCIQSWGELMPDFEIVRWDESNYNITNTYAREAYEKGYYAFVSDVARLDIIFNEGGIYLDTDVELIKSLDNIVDKGGYLGFQKKSADGRLLINTGLGFAAPKGDPVIKALLDDYQDIHFVMQNGEYDTTSCPVRNSLRLEQMGTHLNDTLQHCLDITIYPSEYFCPMNFDSGEMEITDKTISIHHYDATWINQTAKIKRKIKRLIGFDKWNKLKSFFNK